MTSAAEVYDFAASGDPLARLARPPGMVGVIAQDTARFSMFAASLTSLEVPAGTQIKWMMGHAIAAQCNDLVRALLSAEGLDWLWILGDDHVFGSGICSKMLAHDKDLVAPLCLTRNPPYKPVMIEDWHNVGHDAFDAEGSRVDFMRRRLVLDAHPDGGLVPIHSVGSAGLLVRRRVFEAMEDPWFEAGKISGVEIGEDYYFCDKARDAGFTIYGDLDTFLGHITTATVWPVRDAGGGWTYGFGMMGGLKLTMPPGAWDEADKPREEAT